MANNNPLPRVLSHYTSLSRFLSIVGKNELWAPNVSYLNDRREILYGLETSIKAIETFTKARKYKLWHEALALAKTSLKDERIPNTYVLCLSGKSDNLGQWRGYGGSTQGVHLNFDRARLTRQMRSAGAHLCKVTYGSVSAALKMGSALSQELKSLDETESVIGDWSIDERNDEAYNAIFRLIPQFKHLDFNAESEYRYIIQEKLIEKIQNLE